MSNRLSGEQLKHPIVFPEPVDICLSGIAGVAFVAAQVAENIPNPTAKKVLHATAIAAGAVFLGRGLKAEIDVRQRASLLRQDLD